MSQLKLMNVRKMTFSHVPLVNSLLLMELASRFIKLVAFILNFLIQRFSWFAHFHPITSRGPALQAFLLDVLKPQVFADTKWGRLQFKACGIMPLYRGNTALTKEPETLEWIDSFSNGDTLWDIGANVGIYSLYAAKKGHIVWAFEPGSANYYVLNQNIELNKLSDSLYAYCLAFSDVSIADKLFMGDCTLGGAFNSFGAAQKEDGSPFTHQFKQGIIGYSIDQFVDLFKVTPPTHLKIDVGSIEDKILYGASKTLRSGKVKTVLVELHMDRKDYNSIIDFMKSVGFQLKAVKRAEHYENKAIPRIYNHIFQSA